jgi:hypothetical protein
LTALLLVFWIPAGLVGKGENIMATPTNLPASFSSGAVLTAAQQNDLRGAFRILQVKQTVLNTTTSTTSGTMVDVAGFSVSITPQSTSNKVLVTVELAVGGLTADDASFNLVRGSTAIFVGSGGTNNVSAFRRMNVIGDNGMDTINLVFLDSPATTSATTYKMQYLTRVGTLFVNRRGSDTNFVTASSITVQEISA